MPKGTTVRISITAVNQDKEIWGDNADVFRYTLCVLSQLSCINGLTDRNAGKISQQPHPRFQVCGQIS
jgi:hypothetical protein